MSRVTKLFHRRHVELLDDGAPLLIIIAFHIPE